MASLGSYTCMKIPVCHCVCDYVAALACYPSLSRCQLKHWHKLRCTRLGPDLSRAAFKTQQAVNISTSHIWLAASVKVLSCYSCNIFPDSITLSSSDPLTASAASVSCTGKVLLKNSMLQQL